VEKGIKVWLHYETMGNEYKEIQSKERLAFLTARKS
jgi:hypothetical protein